MGKKYYKIEVITILIVDDWGISYGKSKELF